jgi:serine/threonine protein kinase
MGLARLTTSQQNYVKQSEGGVLPVRWMAPETLQQHGVYTEASDVWGFGVCGMWQGGSIKLRCV